MLKTIIILITFPLCLSCHNISNIDTQATTRSKVKFNWVKQPKVSNASDSLFLSIKTNTNNNHLKLLLTNSIGTTYINGITKKEITTFTIPKHFSTRAGILNYSLICHTAKIGEGIISIIADNNTRELESYFGPQHIVASSDDFAMLVTIPTDIYDNPNKKSFYNYEMFKDLNETHENTLKEIIHYRKVFSKTTKGKIFVQSNNGMIHSKKFEATILASSPTNFEIDFNRNHSIADGKELTTVSTSTIKDIYDNVIENGTLVNFKMEGKNTIVTAFGKTINGIATTQILHPTSPENFVVSAFINGYAKSNELTLQYK